MLWTRWTILYGTPAALALLTVWSAVQARASRATKEVAEIVVASGEAGRPSLNPYEQATEAGHEITGLIHEPLLRIDAQGRITRGIAERWFWSQTVSYWFAQEKFATQAAEKLRKLDPAQWSRWRLTLAEAAGNELRLVFSEPDPRAGARVMETISPLGPLPVETLRVELNEPAQQHHAYFMQNAVEREQIKDVWFDGPNAYEAQVSGEALRLFEELSLYYQNRPNLGAKVRLVAKQPMLARSALELQLREGVKFHDGTPVTAVDVARTLRLITEQPWPVPGRDALRRIHMMDSKEPLSLRMTFRETYAPLPAAFIGLPVLPAAWIEKHRAALAQDAAFEVNPPPGTGPYKLERQADDRVVLTAARVRPDDRRSRVHFMFGRSPGNIRIGFAMNSVDVFWPGLASIGGLSTDARVALQAETPRNRLLVLWNCRKAPLDNVVVRRALGESVDRQALLKDLLKDQGQIHEGIYRPDLWFGKARDVAPARPLEARKALYELGWTKDAQNRLVKGTELFRLELLTVAGNAERMTLARRLADAWEANGIEVTVTAVSWEEMLGKRLPEHKFDAVLLGLDYDVSWDQSPFWHSSQAARGLNYAGVSDIPLDAMLDSLRVEPDLDRIATLAQQVEERVLALQPYLPLFSGANVIAVRKDALGAGSGTGGDGLRTRLTAEAPARAPAEEGTPR